MIEMWTDPWALESWWRGLAGAMLASTPCALVGVFLYLRRMSLVADALSHIALPGIVVAFLLSGSVAPAPMLLGAVSLGVVSSVAMDVLAKRAAVRSDAAIGIVFTALFALGIVLLSMFVQDAHIDTQCTLFGDVLAISDDALLLLACVTPAILCAVVLCWRWLTVVCFDPGFAHTLGLPVTLVHYALMAGASGATVASFEAVGAILAIALIVIPAATAHLLCDRMHTMLAVAWGHGLLSALVGMYLAYWLDVSASGAIVLSQGTLYLLAFLFAPHHGALSRVLTRRTPPPTPAPAP